MLDARKSDETALFELGLDSLSVERAAAALPAIERGVSTYPHSARLWHVQALLLRELGRLRDALSSFERAQALAPQQPKIAYGLASSRFEAGLPAVDAYATALQLNSGQVPVILGLAEALLAEGRAPEAMLGLERLLARAPGWVAGHELLCRIRWMEGERSGFDRSFAEAIRVAPQNLDLRRAHFVALLHAKQFDILLQEIANARSAIGHHLLFDVNEGIALAEMGELERGERLLAPYAELDDITVQVRRMRLLLRSGRPEEASLIYERHADAPDAAHLIPYASLTWRMMGDSRAVWLEGDPRLIGTYDLADRLPPLAELAVHLRSLHRAGGQQLEQSVRGGTQTEGSLLTHIHPLIEQTSAVLRDVVRQHCEQLPSDDSRHHLLSPPRNQPVRFAGSWSVRLHSGGHHSNHVHPMGWLSSALYIALPAGDVSANGVEARAGWLTLGEPQAELGLALPPFRSIEPKPGRLVLFPSTMWHGTVPFGAGERLTIAFDVASPR
ncbi:MAG: putative 2OG-Fe(II) oxygenase [Sphingomicrobium sp.]|nr:tetratricopeptide repeat protein [Sphingomonadales bacterium]